MSPDGAVALCVVTRLSRADFVARSLLARSLRSVPQAQMPRIELHADNAPPNPVLGLGEIYDRVLRQARDGDAVVFVHDDAYLHDWFFADRVREALQRFDVVGVAGNRAPDLAQPSWALRFDAALVPLGWQDRTALSGAVGHGDPAAPPVDLYGPTPAACGLLDGVFLAVDVSRARGAGVSFDSRFRFHCYDLDFCRTAAAAGLRVGTWPIAVTHASAGNFASPAWQAEAAVYLQKWRR